MSSVTITADPGCHGEQVAREVGAAVGRVLVAEEVYREAAGRAGLGAEQIRRAMDQPASLFGMSLSRRRRCAAHVEAVLLGHLLEDGGVYLGPAGHLFVRGIAHVVRVHLTAAPEHQAAELAREAGVAAREAARRAETERRQRQWWARTVHGDREEKADPFDLVVPVDRLGVEGAISSIVSTAQERRFLPTTYSRAYLRDAELQARVRAQLIASHPAVTVTAAAGSVSLRVVVPPQAGARTAAALKEMALRVDGVKDVSVDVVESRFE